MSTARTPIQKRYDFVLLFDVHDGNPNGDPDAGNLPRMDPETGHGLVTDVCLKRKVRNYVALTKSNTASDHGDQIYVSERAVLNLLHKEAYKTLKITLNESVCEVIPEPLHGMLNDDADLPDEFSVEENAAGESVLVYSGLLDKEQLKETLQQFHDIGGPAAKTLADKLSKKVKARKANMIEIGRARDWMCQTYFDVRTFGAVMSTAVNAGQVRGPVQMTFARSADRILVQEHAVTRIAITTEKEAEGQFGQNRTMGRKTTVPYGLYRTHGFVSPALAKGTGFSDADLALFFEALENMFEHDRSAAKGLMSTRALVIFEHDSALGNAPAHMLFEKVKIETLRTPARSFADYHVTVDGKALPGVRATYRVTSEGKEIALTAAV